MPFAFTLPTTSSITFTDFISSSSHPSLPLTATTYRSVLRDALKKHKRLSPSSQSAHLPTVQDAVKAYLPYILTLHAASQGREAAGERVDIASSKELEVEWRTTITSTIPGREAPRMKLKGFHNELLFALQTLAYVSIHLARTQLSTLHKTSQEQRGAAITAAMKHLIDANSIHTYALNLPSGPPTQQPPVDTAPSTQSALASLALAEATLIVVLKDDPYAAAVAEDRNKDNTDWMFKAPSIPKVRAHLFARLCLATADHAAQAAGLLACGANGGGKIDDALLKYVDDLRRTARGRAARFLGIDAEIGGQTGEGIAWLRGAKKELGFWSGEEDGKRRGLKGLKQSWAEKREDRKVAKGKEGWGMDAGKLEEGRVVEWLEAKWVKENDTVNVQLVPPFEPLLASMPSGREYHTPKPFVAPSLEPDVLARMRAPPDPEDDGFRGNEEDSDDENTTTPSDPVGAFPGTRQHYEAGSNYY
ncbi:hypothetical protein M8818_002791 [Zalaria obscura]|uniref:Uncharacterized protein n=1 Tax=Zalaria obscura TaxID=2024903 RepID=A0ACC3SHI9_9PEZI